MMKRRPMMSASGRMKERSMNTITETNEQEGEDEEILCELRPGGMLVQKRTEKNDDLVANVLVRVCFGAVTHEVSVDTRASFGMDDIKEKLCLLVELKKLLAAKTGLHPTEQDITFRGRERKDGEYLDISGVKNRSKLILTEDACSKERRFIELRKNARIQNSQRAVNDVTIDIDKLADQVSAMKKSVKNGTKVPEVQITTLTEMLMRQAIKLENISSVAAHVASQKHLQGERVQKWVETLDALKISNANIKPAIITTQWETFDPPPTSPQWELFN